MLQISWNLGIIHLAASNETWLARGEQNVSEKLQYNMSPRGQIGRRASGVTKCMFACKCKESKHIASEARKEEN